MKHIGLFIIALVALLSSVSVSSATKENIQKEKFIKNLIKKMTLDEKINQLNDVLSGGDPAVARKEAGLVRAGAGAMFNVAGADLARKYQKIAIDSTRLKIPLLFGFDCVHGMRTIFPIPLGGAASWDLKKIEESERIAALEASALGVNWVYAPMVDVCRDARWGRIAEGAGEDTYLGSRVAEARVKGFQGKSLKNAQSVASCVKHYAAYGAAEGGRDYNTIELSEGTMRNIYLPPYKAAIDAGAPSLMSAFNAYHGVPATCNEWLLKDVLRNEWGFKGFVVSDFEAIAELLSHGVAADSIDAARIAINAGLDMDMKSNIYINKLTEAVKSKTVSESAINKAVEHILSVKYDLGLFDNPYLYCDNEREKRDVFTCENRNEARDLAKSSIVLLKNNNNVLPLSKDIKSVAVIGELANSKTDMNGTWIGLGRGDDPVSILEGIKGKIPNANVKYAEGSKVRGSSKMDDALHIAKDADVIILSMGEYGWMTGEGQSYANIELPNCQMDLFRELKKLNKPIVVILSNGRPLVIPEVADKSDALVESWFLGTEGGNAIADVIFGDYNPSGKLPVSFPESMGQLPFYYNQLPTGRPLYERPTDPLRSIYRDISNKALYPFGYGLSYTKFCYTDLQVIPTNGGFKVAITIENVGSRGGEEVAQLYTRKVPSSISQPIKSLKGFEKIYLSPKEKKVVTFDISKKELEFYKEKEGWIFEPGNYKVYIGGDSENTVSGEVIIHE